MCLSTTILWVLFVWSFETLSIATYIALAVLKPTM